MTIAIGSAVDRRPRRPPLAAVDRRSGRRRGSIRCGCWSRRRRRRRARSWRSTSGSAPSSSGSSQRPSARRCRSAASTSMLPVSGAEQLKTSAARERAAHESRRAARTRRFDSPAPGSSRRQEEVPQALGPRHRLQLARRSASAASGGWPRPAHGRSLVRIDVLVHEAQQLVAQVFCTAGQLKHQLAPCLIVSAVSFAADRMSGRTSSEFRARQETANSQRACAFLPKSPRMSRFNRRVPRGSHMQNSISIHGICRVGILDHWT